MVVHSHHLMERADAIVMAAHFLHQSVDDEDPKTNIKRTYCK